MRKRIALILVAAVVLYGGKIAYDWHLANSTPETPAEAMQALYDSDFARAKRGLDKFAAAGDAESQFTLGAMYLWGRGVDPDPVKAAELLTKAAEQKHLQAAAYLGTLLWLGDGVKADPVNAVKWMSIAAEGGEVESQSNLGQALLTGAPDVPADPEKGRYWMEKAARAGNPLAARELGLAFANPDGPIANPAEGAVWLLVAQRRIQAETRDDILARKLDGRPPAEVDLKQIAEALTGLKLDAAAMAEAQKKADAIKP